MSNRERGLMVKGTTNGSRQKAVERLLTRILQVPYRLLDLLEAVKDLRTLEERTYRLIAEVTCDALGILLEALDDQFRAEVQAPCEGKAVRTLVGVVGEIRFQRRFYRGLGFVLDERMGIPGRSRISPWLREWAVEMATEASYRTVARWLSRWTGQSISHQTVWNEVQTWGEQRIQEQARERERVFGEGRPAPEGQPIAWLHVEGDGVAIALQKRGRQPDDPRRGELKVAIAYEGWEDEGRPAKRRRLKHKIAVLGMEDSQAFAERTRLAVGRHWSWEQVLVSGDGAAFVKTMAEELEASWYQLSRYHLRKAIHEAIHDASVARTVWDLANSGQTEKLFEVLEAYQAALRGKARNKVAKLIGYLKANEDGLADYRQRGLKGIRADQPGIGSIESSNEQIVCNRYKKLGRAWSVAGADRLARLIELQHNGELAAWLRAHSPFQAIDTTAVHRALPPVRALLPDDPEAWLRARLPALSGPANPTRHALAGLAGLRLSA